MIHIMYIYAYIYEKYIEDGKGIKLWLSNEHEQ